MQFVQGNPAITRRATFARAAKAASGVALTVALLGAGGLQPVAAQDDTIVLSGGNGGGATLTVSPGNADAVSAVAEAHASPGHAETIAAGARAVADSDCGAFTEASAASAVAIPDAGAATEAEGGAKLGENGIGLADGSVDESLAVSDPAAFAEQLQAQIRSENEALQMIEGNGGADNASEPVRAEAKNQKDGKEISIRKVEECIAGNNEEEKKIEPPAPEEVPVEVPVVVEVPTTGSGAADTSALSSLLAAAAAVAAFGAVALRKQSESSELLAETIGAGK